MHCLHSRVSVSSMMGRETERVDKRISEQTLLLSLHETCKIGVSPISASSLHLLLEEFFAKDIFSLLRCRSFLPVYRQVPDATATLGNPGTCGLDLGCSPEFLSGCPRDMLLGRSVPAGRGSHTALSGLTGPGSFPNPPLVQLLPRSWLPYLDSGYQTPVPGSPAHGDTLLSQPLLSLHFIKF